MKRVVTNSLLPRGVKAPRVPFWSMRGAGAGSVDTEVVTVGYGDAERLADWTALAYRASWLDAELRGYVSAAVRARKRRRSPGFRPDLARAVPSPAPWTPDLAYWEREKAKLRREPVVEDDDDGDWLLGAFEPGPGVRWRDAELGPEVAKLYNAMSFLTWQHGVSFDTHVVLSFKLMGIADQREAASLMAPFNKEVKRWLAVGPECPRRRWTKRARAAQAQEHLWLYVFEVGSVWGFHAHELCVVPTSQVPAFRAHARAWWTRAACLAELPEGAVHVEHRRARGWSQPYERQVGWLRYVLKSTKEDLGRVDGQGRWRSYAEILQLEPWGSERQGTKRQSYAPQLYGICQALGETAQARAGFRSRLDEGRLDEVYSGWELIARDLRALSV